jgi:hypothetical protein
MPRENSSVPSIGSMINLARAADFELALLSPVPISSPKTSSATPLAATFARAMASIAPSASVIAVPSSFLATRMSTARK